MNTRYKTNRWQIQHLLTCCLILCCACLIKRLVWGQHGILHYQKRQILQHTMVNQLGALRTQNSQIQSQITRLKQHPEYATSAIRMQLNRIRPNETFYVTD